MVTLSLVKTIIKDCCQIKGKVHDRTDGKLVHLDGLNFSRAYNLYSIIKNLASSSVDLELK